MSKNGAPPPYGFVPPQSAPPSYAQAVNGVPPSSPYVPQQTTSTHIVSELPIHFRFANKYQFDSIYCNVLQLGDNSRTNRTTSYSYDMSQLFGRDRYTN